MKKDAQTLQEFCQLNTSPSKMSFSFSKQERFRVPRIDRNQTFYEVPSNMGSRATGFGYGVKSSMILPTLKNPSPDHYHLQSELLYQQRTKKGSIFGESRDKTQNGSIFRKDTVPGPGQYELMKSSLTNISYSIKGKSAVSLHKESDTPGPGTYENGFTNKDGLSFVSSMRNTSVRINPLKEKKDVLDNLPGPGTYENHSMDIDKGSFVNSKLKNTQKCIFPKTIRPIGFLQENKTPGPGTYNRHSDFQ